MASLKGKIYQHNNHKVVSRSLLDIKGLYIRADGTWIHRLAGEVNDVTNDVQQPVTHIRHSLGQDTTAAHWGSLPAERIQTDGDFELGQM